MSVELKVPVFPESVTDGTLVSWRKKVGDAVKRDEVIADVETDKVVFEVPALEDGVISELLEQEGAVVVSGQVIAKIDTQAQMNAQVQASAQAAGSKVEQLSRDAAQQEVSVSPAARKLIEENHLQASAIQGSARGGRISKDDVIQYIKQNQSGAVAAPVSMRPQSGGAPASTGSAPQAAAQSTQVAKAAPPSTPVSVLPGSDQSGRPQKRVPMTRLRARIAERLVESQKTAAILSTFNEINMQPVMELRQKYKDQFEKQHDARLGFMSFFVKAVVEALKRYPDVNASVEDKDIIYHGYYDIGIAVGSPRGLVVPILRDADTLSFADIERKISEFGTKAKDGSLSLDDITGGTFSITNGGVFGSLLSTPIINPPQSGILGMHKIEKRAVVENDEVVIRPMMYVALSYDHRIIDGRGAVQFLVTIKELLEDPARLLLEV